MADFRFVPKSATKSATSKSATTAASKSATKSASKMTGAFALVGALAGAGALLVWGCTDNSGNGKFVEPNRPFADAAADGASSSVDAATTDGGVAHPDGANSDLGADR